MPIWIRVILIFWVVTALLMYCVRIWQVANPFRVMINDYPTWFVITAFAFIISLFLVIPFAIWVIFYALG